MSVYVRVLPNGRSGECHIFRRKNVECIDRIATDLRTLPRHYVFPDGKNQSRSENISREWMWIYRQRLTKQPAGMSTISTTPWGEFTVYRTTVSITRYRARAPDVVRSSKGGEITCPPCRTHIWGISIDV